jgi:hypothetical protein
MINKKDKDFFLENGYLHFKKILPQDYVQSVQNEGLSILKKNGIVDFSREIDNAFLRLNFGNDKKFFGNYASFPKNKFNNIFEICSHIFGDISFDISGLDNRIFCGLKNRSKDQEKRVKTSYWHIDGWNNYHFLNVQSNAMPILFSFSDNIESGGTMVIPTSIKFVCEFMFNNPHGLHPDSMGGYSHIVPFILERCGDEEIHQLKIEQGDVIFMHPFMLHKSSINISNTPKMVNNNHPQLREPIKLNRQQGNYSLIERSIIQNLELFDIKAKNFQRTSNRLFVSPPVSRTNLEKEREITAVFDEMKKIKQDGYITPSWVTKNHNYLSNTDMREENLCKINRYNYAQRGK